MSHNHLTRVVLPEGNCPSCDEYHERVRVVSSPDYTPPPGPHYPPTPPFKQAFG